MVTAPTAITRMSRRLSDVTHLQGLANNGFEVRLHRNSQGGGEAQSTVRVFAAVDQMLVSKTYYL